MMMQKEEIWGEKVKSRVQGWPRLVFLLAPTDGCWLVRSAARSASGALPLSGDRVEPCGDRPHRHAGGIPRATLEQGTRSSQTELCFSHLLFLWEPERN